MSDRDFKRLVIGIGLGFLGLAIVNSIYRAGFAAGVGQDGGAAGTHYGGFGFFPFPPLLLIGLGLFLFFAWRRRWDGNGPGAFGRGPGGRPPRFFEEWHRRAHEAGTEGRRDGGTEGPGVAPAGYPAREEGDGGIGEPDAEGGRAPDGPTAPGDPGDPGQVKMI